MTLAEIEKLRALAEQAKLRDVAAYVSVSGDLEKIDHQIRTLGIERRNKGLVTANDFKSIAVWQRWAESEMTKLEHSRNHVALEKEQRRHEAMRSSAKVRSLEMLSKKASKEAVLQNRKRAEQNGLPPDA